MLAPYAQATAPRLPPSDTDTTHLGDPGFPDSDFKQTSGRLVCQVSV
jgi:hypothetical protein